MMPKKNVAYSFDISLVDQANRPQFKASPTLAVGDFKVSTDGSALTNLGTLPTVTPAGSVVVHISLSSTEMNGDRIIVVSHDAAGAEWDDVTIYIDTTVVSVDDLTRSTTPANALNITATGRAESDLQTWRTTQPNVLISGRIDSDAEAINNSTTAASNLNKSANTIIQGTVDAGVTPTTITFSDSTNLTSTVNDFYKGRVVIFTSGALNRQATAISAYNGTTHAVTVSPALTSAPSVADTYVIV